MAEKFSGGVPPMSVLAIEMREAIIELSGPRSWVDTRQRWLERGARAAGISYRMAKGLFYGECDDPRSSVVESVRAAVTKQREKEARARAEFEQVRSILNDSIASLEQVDPDFYRDELTAFRQEVARARQSQGPKGPADSPVDRGGK